MVERQQVFGHRRAGLVVGAADIVGLLERRYPALPHHRLVEGAGSGEDGRLVRAHQNEARRLLERAIDIGGAVRPVDGGAIAPDSASRSMP